MLSPSDSWTGGQRKMEEYQANGCRLGWLLDPKGKRVGIYRPHQPVQILHQPLTLVPCLYVVPSSYLLRGFNKLIYGVNQFQFFSPSG
ncbi:Uma2 family endonuclease [Roseofilum capinflatum]|uniref:Uma2 family endonuclease n=1 Tax=Roseofilum capinflatum BLCC-M114 TaxID=3022440 RepID=A0ABT7BEB1_9CYAN|nr:Uma2 family endonuclease [Roseofilum capinflatum]MDJ1176618.1 Uma2 family endonuclease [Roseofilum capinflatum BLCC-M114]